MLDDSNGTADLDPAHGETSDAYGSVIFTFPQEPMRIIRCKGNLQWIVQRRDKAGHSKWPWKALAFCVTRAGLTRVLRSRYRATPGLRNFVDRLPKHIHQQAN